MRSGQFRNPGIPRHKDFGTHLSPTYWIWGYSNTTLIDQPIKPNKCPSNCRRSRVNSYRCLITMQILTEDKSLCFFLAQATPHAKASDLWWDPRAYSYESAYLSLRAIRYLARCGALGDAPSLDIFVVVIIFIFLLEVKLSSERCVSRHSLLYCWLCPLRLSFDFIALS